MHAIKAGWVGQIFALAKCNESEGKKSQIRRSKEERKAMVESFIKMYQSSNNGNFPSLNLTQKEVGGSFYTVREIVREIIQENRVLGPAKLISEELNISQFDEEYLLGTISAEPEIPSDITSNGNPFVPNHHQSRSQEPVSISHGLCDEHENQMPDNAQIINETKVDVKFEQSAKRTCEELQTSKSSEKEEKFERFSSSTSRITPITAAVVVETFPLRPVPKTADFSSAKSGVNNLTETLKENEIEKVDLEPCNGSAPLDQIHSLKNSVLLDGQKQKTLADVVLVRDSDLVNKKVVDPQLKSSDYSTRGETVHETGVGTDWGVEVEVSHNDVLTSEINEGNEGIDGNKEISGLNGKIPRGIYGSRTKQESRTLEANVIENEADTQQKESSQKGSYPIVDKIHLESWESASRKSGETETNPVLAIFKSFVTAIMKFWSE